MNPDSALVALSASLNEEGPAVEISPDHEQRIPGEPRGRGGAEPGGIAAVVSHLGSTGTPKRTALSVEALASSSMATAVYLGSEGQWLLALPLHYVAGLSVLVRSLYAGTRPWAMDLDRSFDAAGLQRGGVGTDRQHPLHVPWCPPSCSDCSPTPTPRPWPRSGASTRSCSAGRAPRGGPRGGRKPFPGITTYGSVRPAAAASTMARPSPGVEVEDRRRPDLARRADHRLGLPRRPGADREALQPRRGRVPLVPHR